jgi:hypothetical protein
LLAAIEGPLAVGASVWLLALAQTSPQSSPGPARPGEGAQRYAAFLLQGVVWALVTRTRLGQIV